MQKKEYSIELGGETLTLRFLNWAQQADASVLAQLGETVVLSTVVMGKKESALSYFPLTVEYAEKYYAAGKIGGGRFNKREGRPSNDATLKGRLIDRTIRPLFNNSMRRDVQVVSTILSYDYKNTPEILALIASSTALCISNIPWDGPIGAVRMAKIDEHWKINPSAEDKASFSADIIASGPKGKINMIEIGANEVQEKDLVDALSIAQKEIDKLVDFQLKIQKEIGEKKEQIELREAPQEIQKEIRGNFEQKIRSLIIENSTKEGKEELNTLTDELKKYLEEKYTENNPQYIDRGLEYFDKLIDELVHEAALKHNKRVDGRAFDEIRNLSAEISILPRTHGSGIFMRGLTHVLSAVTLDSPGEEELSDAMEGEAKKRFMHHYNFPPYSVGEVGFFRGPGRREIGHGALAEKALQPLIPVLEEFPYVVRVVTEAISSNGSTSMASVCGSSLALMDAGVPIKNHIAGIAMGLITDGKNTKILTDIQGPEDHYGDMDFKVAGTRNGVTAVQLDVKIGGLDTDLVASVLEQAKKARLQIIQLLEKIIPSPREEISKYAPVIEFIKIEPSTIAILIGSGGRTIKELMAQTNTEIDVEDDGSVYVSGALREEVQKAIKRVEQITHQVEIGEIYEAKVVRIADFGAFVELTPGQDALVHVSEISSNYVKNVSDIVKVGDTIRVKVIKIDESGKIAASARFNDANETNKTSGKHDNAMS